MVQNQVTISAPKRLWFRGLSAKAIGGRPKRHGSQGGFHNTTPLRQPRQLAEGVGFPERYADFSLLWPCFGGGGSPGWTATGLVVILNHAEILNNLCPFKRPNHGTLESLVSRQDTFVVFY